MNATKNTIRIISVLNAYYRRITKIMRIMCVLKAHHENNACCVRIKGVLFLWRMTKVHPRVHGKRSGLPLYKLLD